MNTFLDELKTLFGRSPEEIIGHEIEVLVMLNDV